MHSLLSFGEGLRRGKERELDPSLFAFFHWPEWPKSSEFQNSFGRLCPLGFIMSAFQLGDWNSLYWLIWPHWAHVGMGFLTLSVPHLSRWTPSMKAHGCNQSRVETSSGPIFVQPQSAQGLLDPGCLNLKCAAIQSRSPLLT